MMSRTLLLGYDDALKLTVANVKPLPPIHVDLMGFLQIALPGLLAPGGHRRTRLPSIKVRLEAALKGRGLERQPAEADTFIGCLGRAVGR